MNLEVIKELADDEYVFSLIHFSGTSDGAMGMPKGPYDMQAIEVMRCKDGKAVEHWEFMQISDMMKMMGTPPATKPVMNEEKQPVKDSINK